MFFPTEIKHKRNQIDKAWNYRHDIDIPRGGESSIKRTVIIPQGGLDQIGTESFSIFCQPCAFVVHIDPQSFNDSTNKEQPSDSPLKFDEKIWT